jgi:hypothetical protein
VHAKGDTPKPTPTDGRRHVGVSRVWGDGKSRLSGLAPHELAEERVAFVQGEAAAGRSLCLSLPDWAPFVPVKVDVYDIQQKIAIMKRWSEEKSMRWMHFWSILNIS